MTLFEDICFSGIALDSRLVQPGWLYVALPGGSTHGSWHYEEAIQRGAKAILTDRQGADIAAAATIPVAVVDDPRVQMAYLAAEICGRPADSLELFAITGTTGKTSTASLLAAGLAAAGVKAATMGTLGVRIGSQALPLTSTTVTTPESPDIQRSLSRLLSLGVEAVAMEVSSHALALNRVDGIVFGCAAFSNLGSDHLDFHHTQEDYFLTKAALFTPARCRSAVVNIDDPYGRRLLRQIKDAGELPVYSAAVRQEADYQVTRQAIGFSKSEIELKTPSGTHNFRLGMPGEFSVRNALVAAALIDQGKYDLAAALRGFADAEVPGRMQRVDLGQDAPAVVIDFAHSPEAISAALASLPGRRIAVIGGGGDRDKAKRVPMGIAAAANSDVVIVTDDNPRSENPQNIRDEILSGAYREAKYSSAEVIDGGERRNAIALALKLAQRGDWVAILGKGHERQQVFAGHVIDFVDAEVVQEEWAKLAKEESG
ncbi:MAG: UDP-N-acetylmuramoyl-L-alanyl-D-glutamate--2,6-diaminopimelate ligase [Propionibacteriaceae bacterium]|nr:UDP-N-acetylmuramoyl-L-alanyl-D-glutamate--2,6-diaminopimelate ligase [Propionibacteriaceae bacterium]